MTDKPAPTPRHDGWTPQRQGIFLEHLAANGIVRHAADAADISHEAAYNLRQRAEGAAFRVGWDAALLLARVRLADALMERAIEGWNELSVRNEETGIRTRQRHDNRLALSLLARLDRLASKTAPAATYGAETPGYADHADARIVADAWEDFLDMVERGADTAALADFLAARRPAEPSSETAFGPCQLQGEAAEDSDGRGADPDTEDRLFESYMVWWCEERREFRTNFPPPLDFDGEQIGDPDTGHTMESDYERSLSRLETEREITQRAAEADDIRRRAHVWRRRWFGIADGEEDAGENPVPGHELDDRQRSDPEAIGNMADPVE